MTEDLKDKIIQALKEHADPEEQPANLKTADPAQGASGPPEDPAIKDTSSEFRTPKPHKGFRNIGILFTALIVLLVIIGLQYSTTLFSSAQSRGPYGKIHSPKNGATTGSDVKITAETRNLVPGTYVWIAVDKPNLDLCWPKKLVKANIKFRTDILEEGPKERYGLSIYALNETLHNQWQEWKDKQIFGGLPMPPDNRRLDTVRVMKR